MYDEKLDAEKTRFVDFYVILLHLSTSSPLPRRAESYGAFPIYSHGTLSVVIETCLRLTLHVRLLTYIFRKESLRNITYVALHKNNQMNQYFTYIPHLTLAPLPDYVNWRILSSVFLKRRKTAGVFPTHLGLTLAEHILKASVVTDFWKFLECLLSLRKLKVQLNVTLEWFTGVQRPYTWSPG